jgi:sulfur-oxidizing protein SoxB
MKPRYALFGTLAAVIAVPSLAQTKPVEPPGGRYAKDAEQVFRSSFRVDNPKYWMSRLDQDETMRLCGQYRDNPPRKIGAQLEKAGNVHLLHFTDCHAQLLPVYFREPSVNLGIGGAAGKAPHLVGEHLLKAFGIKPGTHRGACLHLPEFRAGGQDLRQGRRLRPPRHAGQAPARRDAPARCCSTAAIPGRARPPPVEQGPGHGRCLQAARRGHHGRHWEFTLGDKRVLEIVEKDFKGKIDFVAQNIKTTDFGDKVFEPYSDARDERRQGRGDRPGLPLHADRQSALDGAGLDLRHPGRQHAEDGRRGARQGRPGRRRALAQRHGRRPQDGLARAGIDAILGGHTHDGVPKPVIIKNAGGQTLVTNAGSNGKFLGVLDFDVKGGKVSDFRYKLLPVFANLLPADAEMAR